MVLQPTILILARPGNKYRWTLNSPLYECFLDVHFVQVTDFGGSMVLQPTILILARSGNKYQ